MMKLFLKPTNAENPAPSWNTRCVQLVYKRIINQNCLVSLDRRTPTGADKPELHSHDANVFKQEGRDREGGGCLLPNILRGGLRGTPGPVCGIQFPSGVGLFC